MAGGRAVVIQANLAERDGLDQVESVVTAELGELDVLIANAASGVFKPLMRATQRDWNWVLGVNTRLDRAADPAVRTSAGVKARQRARDVEPRRAPRDPPLQARRRVEGGARSVVRQLAAELGPEACGSSAGAGLMETRVLDVMGVAHGSLAEARGAHPLGRS